MTNTEPVGVPDARDFMQDTINEFPKTDRLVVNGCLNDICYEGLSVRPDSKRIEGKVKSHAIRIGKLSLRDSEPVNYLDVIRGVYCDAVNDEDSKIHSYLSGKDDADPVALLASRLETSNKLTINAIRRIAREELIGEDEHRGRYPIAGVARSRLNGGYKKRI